MSLTDLIWPKRCPVCMAALPPGKKLICAPCVEKLRRVSGAVCLKCGKPLADEYEEYCGGCRKNPPSFSGGVSYLHYSSEYTRQLITQVKYYGNVQLLDYPCLDFARTALEKVSEWGAEALIPVPVHVSRLRTRGYNQAEEIAERLADIWKIPVDASLLVRSEATEAQKNLSREARLMNLKHAFSVPETPAPYRKVILVDDIYTTGSTAEACTRTLLDAGVEEVYLAMLSTSSEGKF